MKTYNIIIYAYLTLLAGLLIACTVFLSIGEYANLDTTTIKVFLGFGFVLLIALLILAPRPRRLRHVTVFGQSLTIDVDGNVRDESGKLLLTLEEGQDADDLETLLWYDYQDNKA